MSGTLQEFLDRSLPLPGVAACCVRFADRTYITRCEGNWFANAQVEQVLGRLALAADSLGYHGLQPTRLCWVFERSRIHLALRQDGACLALFVENRPGIAFERLESVMEAFQALPTLGTPATAS